MTHRDYSMLRAAVCALLLGAIVASPQARGQNPNIGTAGARFLRISVGARAAAMGGACIAAIDDASALFWNPAGIAAVSSVDVMVSHTPWWATTKLNSAALAASFGDIGSFGASVTVLSMGTMEVTTEQQPEGTGQMFDASDMMIGVSYARRLTEDFSVGITGKYVNQRIWNETASSWAVDIGTQYRTGFRDLTLGMSMTNFGPDMTYGGRDLSVKYDVNANLPDNRLTPSQLAPEEFPLPLHFQVGISMSPYISDDLSVLLAADVTHPSDNQERVQVGSEVSVMKYFHLRGGYRFNYDDESATFGAGVEVPVSGSKLRVDFGYALYKLLPDVSRFTVGMTF